MDGKNIRIFFPIKMKRVVAYDSLPKGLYFICNLARRYPGDLDRLPVTALSVSVLDIFVAYLDGDGICAVTDHLKYPSTIAVDSNGLPLPPMKKLFAKTRKVLEFFFRILMETFTVQSGI
jgi:hypothetical protein